MGNPGNKYDKTRHNIGRMVIDTMAEKYHTEWRPQKRIYWETEINIEGNKILLVKPDTYMNNSGEAVRKVAAKYMVKPENIVAIVDEYNFPVNKIQIKLGGSNGGHNGTASIIEELNNENFCRLRCGIGKNFEPGGMVDYVLQRFADEEFSEVEKMITKTISSLEYLAVTPFGKAASEINSGEIWNPKAKKEKQKQIKKVTIYAGSSNKCNKDFLSAASELGKLLAEKSITAVYGGGKVGLMGNLADSIIENKGKIIGVIPEFLENIELGHKGITYMHVTKTMAERKAKLIEGTDAVIVLPGGIGTIEEVMEVITLKQLGKFTAPIIFLNINDYFRPLIDMLEKSIEEKFMLPVHRAMFSVTDKVEKVLEVLEKAPAWNDNALKLMEEKIGNN